jgi:hypothetical protein
MWCAAAAWWGIYLIRPFQPETAVLMNSVPWLVVCSIVMALAGISLRDGRNGWYCSGEGVSWWQFVGSLFSLAVLIKIAPSLNGTLILIAVSIVVWLAGRAAGFGWIVSLARISMYGGLGLAMAEAVAWQLRLRPVLFMSTFSRLTGRLLCWMGYKAVVAGDTVTVLSSSFIVDQVKSGLVVLPFFVLPFCALLLEVASNRKKSRVLKATVIGFLAAALILAVRMVGLAVLSFSGRFPVASGLFTSLYWWGGGGMDLLVWLAPVTLVWGRLLTWVPGAKPGELGLGIDTGQEISSPDISRPPKWVRNRAWTLISLTGALVLWAAAWWCPGWQTFVPFEIYIDETHSAWEPTYVEHSSESSFDPENNYRLFLERMARAFDIRILMPAEGGYPMSRRLPSRVKVIQCADSLDEIYLNLPVHAVLIIKCPTKAYSDKEIEAVERFVHRGGCLFMIGEHTNSFLMNDNLSSLSERFGIHFNRDSIYGITGSWPLTVMADYRLHPVTAPMSAFMWATSSSLRVSSPAVPLIVSPPAGFSDKWNPHRRNFFGNLSPGADTGFGSRVLAAVTRHGLGKVLAFTDSTSFNNYMINTLGRETFIDGLFSWFGKGPSFNYLLPLALALTLGHLTLLKGGTMSGRVWRVRTAAILLPAAAMGSCLGLMLAEAASGDVFSLRRSASPALLVDACHDSRQTMMVGPHTDIMGPDSYDRFFLAISRTGNPVRFVWPGPVTAADLEGSRVFLVVAPTRSYRRTELTLIENYVKRGGRLVLVDGSDGDGTINRLAGLFGLNFRSPGGFGPLTGKTPLPSPTIVNGGKILLTVQDLPVIAVSEIGEGFVLAIGDDTVFSSLNLRGAELDEIRPLLCELIDLLFRGKPDDLNRLQWSLLLQEGN